MPPSRGTFDKAIDFVGQWSRDERTRVRGAIACYEAAAAAGARYGEYEPWVALVHTLGEGDRYYTAHRLEHDRVVTASSAEHLAQRISELLGNRQSNKAA